MSEHLAVSTLVSGDHSMQHLICVKRAIQVQARWTADNARATLRPLVIHTMSAGALPTDGVDVRYRWAGKAKIEE
jgi:hypothetical protein